MKGALWCSKDLQPLVAVSFGFGEIQQMSEASKSPKQGEVFLPHCNTDLWCCCCPPPASQHNENQTHAN